MNLKRKLIAGNLISILLLSESIFAQPSPPLGGFLPGSAQSQQVGRALQSQQPKPAQAAPNAPTQPGEAKLEIPEALRKIKFKLNGINLKGNTVYSTAQLSQFYKPLLHKTISVADLFVVMQKITNYYRNNGYILSRAVLSEQKVTNGIVQIDVIEGYVGKVTVIGTPYGAKRLVSKMGNKLTIKRPLQLTDMEKYLFILNEIPGTSVKANLAASKEKIPALGSAQVNLLTENHPLMGYFSYDNYGTRYIGPQQMTANIGFNSFLMSGDTGQFTFTKTPKGRELTYLDGNYNLPLDYSGSRLLLGATHTDTHPLFVLAPIKIHGLTDNYYMLATFPLIRSRTSTLNLRLGFYYLDSPTTFLNDVLLYVDHLRSLDLGITYVFSDNWNGSNQILLDFKQGLPIWGYSSDNNPKTAQTSRPGGCANYSKIALNMSRLQAIKGPFSLYGLVMGQYGFEPLLSSEQFAFGGPVIGRGYDPSEILGDRGAALSLELRFTKAIGRFGIDNLQFYGFYDGGITWDYLFIGNVPIKQSATSAGFGMRFYMTKYVSGNIMWTKPLTRKVAAEALIGRGGETRVFFSVIANLG